MAEATKRRYGTGSVYQSKDGRWHGQWSAGRDEAGNRVRGTVSADTEAKAWRALNAARSSSTIRRKRRAAESVGDYLDRWLEYVKANKRERTYWGYVSIVEHHIRPQLGDLPLHALDRRTVQAWVDGQTGAPMSIRHRLDCLRGALSRAVRWDLLEANPAKDIDLPPVTRRAVRAMSPDDARALLAAVEDEWFAPLVTVALYTGLRQGELLGLRWEDVNLAHGGLPGVRADDDAVALRAAHREASASLTVHNSLARLPGRHGTRYVLDAPKSARSRRTVPLAPPAVAALREARKAALDGAANQHGLVFARPDGRPIDGPRLLTAFKAAQLAAGLEPITWHDLRHGWVSLMLEAGVPLVEVSHMAGHSGVSITADLYSHLTIDSRAEAIDRMARRIG